MTLRLSLFCILALAATSQAQTSTSHFTEPGYNKYVWVDSPNFNVRAPGTVVDTIVLHHTASPTMAGTIEWFATKASQVSAHYVIGRDGSVAQMVNTNNRAWHAGVATDVAGRKDMNSRSVGIEMVNNGDGLDPYPTPQVEALKHLIAVLMIRYPIKQIVSHEYIADPRGRKDDPINFPWSQITKFGVPLFYGLKPLVAEPDRK